MKKLRLFVSLLHVKVIFERHFRTLRVPKMIFWCAAGPTQINYDKLTSVSCKRPEKKKNWIENLTSPSKSAFKGLKWIDSNKL